MPLIRAEELEVPVKFSAVSKEKTFIQYSFLVGLMSLSNVVFECVIACYVAQLSGQSLFVFALVFSTMIASIGLGGLLFEKISLKASNLVHLTGVLEAVLSITSLPVLYFAFFLDWPFEILVVGFSILGGILAGLRIPMIHQMSMERVSIQAEYLWGGLGGLLSAIFFIPFLGVFRTILLVPMMNAIISFWLYDITRDREKILSRWVLFAASLFFFLWVFSFSYVNELQSYLSWKLYLSN